MNRLTMNYKATLSFSGSAKEFAHAVILPILVMLYIKLWGMIVKYLLGDKYSESPLEWIATQLICVYLPILISVCMVISHWGSFRIWALLSRNDISLKEFLKWGCIGMVINIPTFVNRLNQGFYFESAEFLVFILIAALSYSLIYPIVEEVIFRGYCYSVLRKYGKLRAFLISTTLFLVAHISVADALGGQFPLSAMRLIQIVIFSAIATHIYESTRKLFLCITFHCAANFMADVGQLARYIASRF